MASFKKQIALSSVFAVVAALSACGKPDIRSKTMDAPATTAPSTSSNPKTAEAENKAGDAALKLAAKNDPAAVAALDASNARKKAALDELAEIVKREGVDQQQIEDAKAKVAAAGAAIPPSAAAGAPASGVADIAIPAKDGGDGAETKAETPPVATAAVTPTVLADAAKVALVETAAHRAFAIAMIQPVMRANFQVFLARNEALRLKKKMEVEKKALVKEETVWLKSLRLQYGLAEVKTNSAEEMNALLERVDGVNLSFLAAPLALRSNWSIDDEATVDKIIKRVQELNISPSDEKVRFRSARLAVKSQPQEESISIMKAFLGYNDGTKTPAMEQVLAAVTEVLRFTNEPAYTAEVERVRVLLIEEYKNNQAAKAIPAADVSKK